MKLSLSVKITIKDFFPKNDKKNYNNILCIFSHNDFSGKLNLCDTTNQNSLNHNVQIFNSNITYNVHMFDIKKSSLLGACQLVIKFDKIKNLNKNDTLFQEETIKVKINQKAIGKMNDKSNNNFKEDLFLYILTEIKIIDKKEYDKQNKTIAIDFSDKKEFNNYNTNNRGGMILNLTPKHIKREKKIKSFKKERETLKRIDTFSNYKELSLAHHLDNESLKNSNAGSLLKKNTSLVKINKRSIQKVNKNKTKNNIDIYGRHRIINSCIDFYTPDYNQTQYSYSYQKEEIKTKKFSQNQLNKKKNIPKKKVTILNLMEKKIGHLLYKQKEEPFYYDSKSNEFTRVSVNFRKAQKNQINCHLKKYSSNFNPVKSKEINYKNNKCFAESDFFHKIKDIKSHNKIFANITERNKDNIVSLSNRKDDKERKNRVIRAKKLSLSNINRLNTDINIYKTESKKNITFNLNSAILQTEIDNGNREINQNMSEIRINLRRNKNKLKIPDLDLEKLILQKGSYIKGRFNKIHSKEKKEEINKGFYSPKLSMNFKFKENSLYNYNNNKTEQEKERYPSKNKERNSSKLLTPKGNPMKLNSLSNNISSDKDKNNCFLKEKDELRKKYLNLIDFYTLLSKKLTKNNNNIIEIKKNYQSIKEKCNYLQKLKNKLIQIYNAKESKKVKYRTNAHFQEEKLCKEIINIKLKENAIYQNIFGEDFEEMEMQNKIKLLISQKKELILNLVKNIVKYYGNISQIYNNDLNKKKLLKSLLDKYNIKEKIKINLNYISQIHKENNFEDKIITEVDEDKENEEEDEEEIKQNINNNQISNTIESKDNIDNKDNMSIIQLNNEIKNDNQNCKKEQQDICKDKKENNENESNNNSNNDENINNLIKKKLIEQFPENYKTIDKFIHLDKNVYSFKDKIFLAFLEEDNLVLKEKNDNNDNNDGNTNELKLNEFYDKYCIEKKENKSSFVYTKKIKQKYVKIKSGEKENSSDKKPKNENSTTISDNNEKIQQSIISKLNEIGEMKNNMSSEKETSS